MLETLSSQHPHLTHSKKTIVIEASKAKEKGRCEPDNGHKSTSKTNSDLKLESERLKTFENWEYEVVMPESLAKAGFYSLDSRSDKVKCAFCNVEICRWESGDSPMEEHIRWSPNCPFLQDHTNNSLSLTVLPPGVDVCGKGEYFPHSLPENEACKLLYKNLIKSHEDFKCRFDSFSNWPKSLKQKPLILAEAGFYYKGVGDQTVCFKCGGGLKDWEDNDDPWEQHALWFPKCEFLLSSKGQEFIDQVRTKFKSVENAPKTSISTKETEHSSEQQAASGQPDDNKLCKICYSNAIEVAFIPCGHLLSCVECSLSLKNVCPVCRKRFDATIRVFPS